MSNLRPESRIKSLEQRATDIEASIVELSNDTAEEFKALFDHVQKGFDQAHTYITENVATKEELRTIQEDITELKATVATMATKDDIAELKESLLDAIKQLWQQKHGE